MQTMGDFPTLSTGYSHVPPGYVASVVTCLEMNSRPTLPNADLPPNVTLVELDRQNLDAYRTLYRKIGSDWLWYSRLVMDDSALSAILGDDAVEVFAVQGHGSDIGLLELDFRTSRECELAFLGLAKTSVGKGLGRALINNAINRAWSRPISRMWVHTCSLDHPSALQFYIRSGFTPYALRIESEPDPRLTGHLPLDAAPHIPVIAPAVANDFGVPKTTGEAAPKRTLA
ncbi:GNAT family N-acetyltransferase [Pararhizobium sp.]|uniref:GNAT family N-acetyltransferase n=1 Tax=Pararhizobium sp. TaxID=1977563 RepID=UPI002D7E859F|nr:GNAT family N-acetyltransferase [Pararhizobium sp.]